MFGTAWCGKTLGRAFFIRLLYTTSYLGTHLMFPLIGYTQTQVF